MFFRGIKQHDENDCASACIATVCKYYGKKIPLTIIRSSIKSTSQGSSAYGIENSLEKIGINSDVLQGTIEEFSEEIKMGNIKLPCIAHIINDNNMPHFVVIFSIKNGRIKYFDPALGMVNEILSKFASKWTGVIISCNVGSDFDQIKNSKEAYHVLFIFLKDLKKYIAGTVFFSIIISIISLLGAIVYKEIIDHFILVGEEQHSHGSLVLTVNRVIIAIIIFYIVQAFFGVLRGYFLSKITEKSGNKLHELFVEKLLFLKNNFFNTRDTGEILARYQKINETQVIFTRVFFTVILETITLLVSGYVLITISLSLFKIVLSISIIYIIISFSVIPFLNTIKRRQIELNSNLITILNELINGIEIIKLNKLENLFKFKYVKQAKKITKFTKNEIFLRSISSVLVILTESIGLVLILLFGANLVIAKEISLGDLISFETLVPFFILPLRNLVDSQSDIQSVYVNMEKLSDILEGEEEDGTELKNIKRIKNSSEILSLKNISFSYDYINDVLNNFNISIKKGEKIAIVGGNGSGKTTLLKIMATLQEPDTGEVIVNNMDMYKNIKTSREIISYVPQMSVVFSGNIRDNITFGKEELYGNIEKSKLNIFKYLTTFQYGLESVITENGTNISGGQKQIIGLCRAIVQDRELILLDEATSNMEEGMEEEFFQYITKEEKTKTVIAIIHNTAIEKYFDRVLVINDDYIYEKTKV